MVFKMKMTNSVVLWLKKIIFFWFCLKVNIFKVSELCLITYVFNIEVILRPKKNIFQCRKMESRDFFKKLYMTQKL